MSVILSGGDEFTDRRIQNIAKQIESEQRLNKAQIDLKLTYLAVLDAYNGLLELGIQNKALFDLKYDLELQYFNFKKG